MKELPKIDLPEEWLIGTGVNKALLSLYTNFPCRLKSEIFVLCMEGEIEASVNLTYIIHSGFISGYQNRYGDNLKPPTNVYHRMTA